MNKINLKEQLFLPHGEYRIARYRDVKGMKVTDKGIIVDGIHWETIWIRNAFTTLGKQLILKLLGKKISITGLEYIAIGTGAAASTIDLDTEVARAPVIFTSTPGATDKFMIYSAYFDPDNPGSDYTISEIGIFGNGATSVADSGDMLSSNVVSPTIPKDTGFDALVVDYTLSFS